MNLTPREKDKLLVAMAAMVARRRLERGVKLWARGQPVSESLQQRLLERKLKQPLEAAEWQTIVDFARRSWQVTPRTTLSPAQILALLNKVFVLRVARAQETLAIPQEEPVARRTWSAKPWQLALGGLIVGLLSLLTPKVWGNGYSVVQAFLLAPPLLSVIAGVFICKLLAVLASSGSGAPGGVFTPTLFVGMATGMLFAQLFALWLPGSETAILLGLAGMATLLAATTHAPIMSALMVCEMTGQYFLLPGLLVACVVASVLSRTLRHDSIYGQHAAEGREIDVLR